MTSGFDTPPRLVTPPAALPVTLAEMKLHLVVVHAGDDADISAKIAGVVSHLDAWGGVLGRCIMAQTWAIDVVGPGPHLLPFPDATSITAVSDGDPLAIEPYLTARGHCVRVSGALPDQAVTISAVYGLSATRLPTAQSLVKLLVQREFDVMAGPDFEATTRAAQEHLKALRWRWM